MPEMRARPIAPSKSLDQSQKSEVSPLPREPLTAHFEGKWGHRHTATHAAVEENIADIWRSFRAMTLWIKIKNPKSPATRAINGIFKK
jgi:hypothetical protein